MLANANDSEGACGGCFFVFRCPRTVRMYRTYDTIEVYVHAMVRSHTSTSRPSYNDDTSTHTRLLDLLDQLLASDVK